MSGDIITGIFAIAGIIVGFVLTAVGNSIAGRHAEQARARDLFAQVVKAVNALEIEKASFRERRDSWRPNFLAVGTALMRLLAAITEGNWVKGAVAGVGELRAWDSAEGERFIDRFQAASGEAGPALVQLSLMSDGLQAAAGEVGDAIGAVMKARKPRDIGAAGQQLHKSVGALRAAVRAYGARKWWHRSGRRR